MADTRTPAQDQEVAEQPTAPFARPDQPIVSPLAAPSPAPTSDTLITLTPPAIAHILELRAEETEPERMGLRLALLSAPHEPFRYDLSLERTTSAAFTDIVERHGELRVIIPAEHARFLRGASLEYDSTRGLVIRNPNKPDPLSLDGYITDDDLSVAIRRVLDTEVNPQLAAHGGEVLFCGHDGAGTVALSMAGGCQGCSLSRTTMYDGVETMLKEHLPDVVAVRDVTDHSAGANPYFR